MDGLYLLWWVQERGVSPAVVAAILALGDLAVIAFELPTGWLADRFGHRRSLIVGSSVQAIGMLWCWLGQGIAGLVTASLLVALGDAFRSGADQALVYRSCRVVRRERDFQRIEARTRATEQIVLVGLILAGGVIVGSFGFAAGWIAEAALSAIGLTIACAMTEPPAVADPIAVGRVPVERPRILSTAMFVLIVPAALLGGAAAAASFLAQTTGATDPQRLTALVATIALAEAAGAALAARAPAAGARLQTLLALSGALVFGAAMAIPSMLELAAAPLAFLFGLAHPLRAAAIQRLARDDARARVASVASACTMAAQTIALPLAGLWRNRRR